MLRTPYTRGIPDWWKIEYFGSVTNANAAASADPDHDGLTNLQEYLAGTDPQSSTSTLRLAIAPGAVSNQVRFSFTAVAGHTYALQVRESLSDGQWTNFFQWNSVSNTQLIEWLDLAEPPQRFFRLVTPNSNP